MSTLDQSCHTMTPSKALQMELFDSQAQAEPEIASQKLASKPTKKARLSQREPIANPPATPLNRSRSAAPAGDQALLPQTLAEVLARLRGTPPSQRRSDLMSAVNTAAQVLDRPLGSLPASPAKLAPLLASGHPTLAGLSASRWSRVRTNLRAALKAVGYEVMAGRDIHGLSAEWSELLKTLSDRKLRHGLSRLLSYLSRAGVTTDTVSTADFDAFQEALVENSLHAHPDRTFRTALKSWNAARKLSPQWPDIRAPLEGDTRRYALEAKEFQEEFLGEVHAYLNRMAVSDPFSRDYQRDLRPATLKQKRLHIMQAASALVSSGFAKNELTSLSILVEVDNVEAALRYMRDRHGGVPKTQLGLQARTLLGIARHWVKAPEEQLRVLSRFACALTVTHQGMAPAVQARLRQFDLRPNLNAILTLPDRVYRDVQGQGAPTVENARRLMMALAVELLTMDPMRMSNLASLSLDRHFQIVRRRGSRVLTIWLSENETKNRKPLVLPVPASTAHLLHLYWSKYQPLLADIPNAHIFPSSQGRHRSPSALGAAISKFISRETGLIMHPHLFRQLAAKISMDAGGGLESARLMLGHSSSETTERHYVHLRADKAYQHLDETISKLRGEAGLINPQLSNGIRNIHGS